MHKISKKETQSGIFLDRVLSLPKGGLEIIDDVKFDVNVEFSLFRSKPEFDLTKIVFDKKKFQTFIPTIHVPTVLIPNQIIQLSQTPPRVMATRFAPLVLPPALHDLPWNYAQRIKQFDAEGNVTTQQHLDRFIDFIDLEEVDDEDVKMRLFAQIFSGEVRKWFQALPRNNIPNLENFETLFLGRWGSKKNPLELLKHYNHLKRLPAKQYRSFQIDL